MQSRKSVRSLSAYRAAIERLGQFRVSHGMPADRALLESIGFAQPPALGDSIVPAAVGPASEFNANGKEIVRKDLPMEVRTGMSHRTWKDWHGNEHSGVQLRSYKAYPRELVPPPSEYLTALSADKLPVLASRILSVERDGEEKIVHILNLFLELFGALDISPPSLEPATGLTVKRLNWRVLPPGQYPFARAMEALGSYIERLPDETTRGVVEHRVRWITRLSPDFMAVGVGGFRDYVVFGFTSKNRYVLESPALGNATYVFSDNWQSLSQKTKREILDGSLHEARVIHNMQWARNLGSAIG